MYLVISPSFHSPLLHIILEPSVHNASNQLSDFLIEPSLPCHPETTASVPSG